MSPNSSGIHLEKKFLLIIKDLEFQIKNYTYNKKNKDQFLSLVIVQLLEMELVEEKTFVGQLRKNFADINFYNSSVPGYN